MRPYPFLLRSGASFDSLAAHVVQPPLACRVAHPIGSKLKVRSAQLNYTLRGHVATLVMTHSYVGPLSGRLRTVATCSWVNAD